MNCTSPQKTAQAGGEIGLPSLTDRPSARSSVSVCGLTTCSGNFNELRCIHAAVGAFFRCFAHDRMPAFRTDMIHRIRIAPGSSSAFLNSLAWTRPDTHLYLPFQKKPCIVNMPERAGCVRFPLKLYSPRCFPL
ncbi:MAG TPA: hypothetical protein ENK58_05545 [Desulfobacterales bacterium]|nr:hypothetical protein [Desulfobacterales bacterium]